MKKKYITPKASSINVSSESLLAASDPTTLTLHIEYSKNSFASHDNYIGDEVLSRRGEQLFDDEEE